MTWAGAALSAVLTTTWWRTTCAWPVLAHALRAQSVRGGVATRQYEMMIPWKSFLTRSVPSSMDIFGSMQSQQSVITRILISFVILRKSW